MRPNPKQLVDFFARSLTSFQSSPDVFRVLCTLPHVVGGGREPGPRRASSQVVRRLVVLDSSFNPPTRAHGEMARSALRTTTTSVRLMLLLSVNNADKAPKPASFPVRLGMMDAFGHGLLRSLEDEGIRPEIDVAVTKMPYFHDKARVIGESGVYGPSSSSSSSSALGEGGAHEPEQVFLAGFDTVIRIFNPKYYGGGEGMKAALGPFFERARLRVTMRTDDEWGGEEEQRAYVRGLGEGVLDEVGGDAAWAGRVDLVQGGGTGNGVSSSRVREMVRRGQREALGEMVDDEVLGWIEGMGLYRE
ncbi:uncharacterized protein TRIREDRAFT_62871 [Trichoderma reesei QM6a]|uniref:Predicted protein n=1 Tax=Hypocrea jecorina (strain QM6a) TaxID=431241 RepID=G0RLG6_HYPJQ|nr:uncharacterized protein TRIREDRAFT_62871 [Trichoderma reesei QM6a]EGR47984.1 predicted protein [Trichoderma reesei QM6a]